MEAEKKEAVEAQGRGFVDRMLTGIEVIGNLLQVWQSVGHPHGRFANLSKLPGRTHQFRCRGREGESFAVRPFQRRLHACRRSAAAAGLANVGECALRHGEPLAFVSDPDTLGTTSGSSGRSGCQ